MITTRRKELFITALIMVAVVASFWLGSRYPDLDDKAMMGGETQLAAIGFDVIVVVPSDASPWVAVLYNTLNWLYTNWRGMAFGLLLGALMLSLLPLLPRLAFKNRFANSLAGMFIGAPLGVCVNCATPIAQGVFASGARCETGLATLVSSPTLNVIVLSILVALFPAYMVATKVGLTLLFIILVIPLLTRYAGFPEFAPASMAGRRGLDPPADPLIASPTGQAAALPRVVAASDSWLRVLGTVVTRLGRNLWTIVRLTLPLMLLAGALGAALVTLLPLDGLADVLPAGNALSVLAAMLLVAFIGVFLPVPIAFDVIVTAVLLQAGLPVGYAMVLLFTLGIFSVYPFMLIWREISRQGALVMFVSLMGLGVLGGVFAHEYAEWDMARQQRLLVEHFSQTERVPEQPRVERGLQGDGYDQIIARLSPGALQWTPVFHGDGISIERTPFAPRSAAAERQFSRIEGPVLGIVEHDNFSVEKLTLRLAESRGVASGDIHNDGWADLAFASDAGIGLYANDSGQGYRQQRLDIPGLDDWIVGTVALVDLNDDGWLDLFFSTYGDGTYVIYNHRGRFEAGRMHRIENQPQAIQANAPAFGDIDRDGRLDIVLGNTSVGNQGGDSSSAAARNVWLRATAAGYVLKPLPAIPGETLTTLLTDLDQDGWLDLIVGNDFKPADVFYLNDRQGGFKRVAKQDGLVPYAGTTTMSLSSADIDNDLIPEVFLGQKAWPRGNLRPLAPEQVCAEIDADDRRRRCVEMLGFYQATREARFPGSVVDCLKLDQQAQQQGCLALKLIWDARVHRKPEHCESLALGWPLLADMCRQYFVPVERPIPELLDQAIASIRNSNILLARNESGGYDDQAKALGIEYAGWAWNAKFADLDNDEWQDLFVVTGDLTARLRHPSAFFRNIGGKGFENRTEEAGLHSWLDTLAYTYTDLDNDGDLDLIVVPAAGPVSVYRNNNQSGRAIAFELRDRVGNRFGIGSRISIHYGDGRHQMRDIQASGGFLSFDAPLAYFGLGDYQAIDRVEVIWSTGETSTLSVPLAAGARYLITRDAR